MKKTNFFVLFFALMPLLSLAQTNDMQSMPKYGNDSITCITNLSIYRENFKNWRTSQYKSGDFDSSYKYWKWVLDNCPKSSLNLFVDGVSILADKINSAPDTIIKEAYIDSLMMLYDQRILLFGDKGNVLARKGFDLFKYRPQETKFIYYTLDEAINDYGNKTKESTLDLYFRITIQMFIENLADKSLIIDNYDKVGDIISYNIDNNESERAKYESVKNGIEIAFTPYANCDDLIPIFTKKFNANPEDTIMLKRIFAILDAKNCTSSELFKKVAIQYHTINPSPESAFMLGKLMYRNNSYHEAIKYLKEATKMKDNSKVSVAYYVMADCYRAIDEFSSARDMAYKAYDNDNSNGEPLMFIGRLYGQSAKFCSGETPVEKNCIYWVAVDMFNQAKKADPSLSEEANKNISVYSQYFPKKESIFFEDLSEGSSYEVGCWINRTTTIRAAK